MNGKGKGNTEMEFKDYYATLEVAKDASQEEIKKAYRKRARKYHPDVNKAADAELRFKEVNEAHEVLKDPEKRAKYDQYGAAWQDVQHGEAPPPGFDEFFTRASGRPDHAWSFDASGDSGFSSFFEHLFGGRAGTRTGRQSGGFAQSGSLQGADIEAAVSLTLEDAAFGGQKEITIPDFSTGENRTYTVNIPKGVLPGKRIRLAGLGDKGYGSGKPGDLFLRVDILSHSRFRLQECDLYTRLPVSPWVAALGGTVPLEILDGKVAVKVPPGSSSGRKIRLRGKGFPDPKNTGDLYAEIEIIVPEDLSVRERELFEELAAASDFVPSAA